MDLGVCLGVFGNVLGLCRVCFGFVWGGYFGDVFESVFVMFGGCFDKESIATNRNSEGSANICTNKERQPNGIGRNHLRLYSQQGWCTVLGLRS